MARSWYAYKGLNSPIELSNSYYKVDGRPGCSDGSQLCAIYAENGGQHPKVISDNIKRYWSNAMVQFVAQPATPVLSEIFVVMKDV